MANISVFGLGYVGCVTVACLADSGHSVIGVDVNPLKVELVASGRSPIIEPGLDDLLSQGVAAGRIRATSDAAAAMSASSVTFICVGTPSRPNGSLELAHVRRVCQEIGAGLATSSEYHVVNARSTMLPGSTEEVVIPSLEAASGKRAGVDFGVCFNPEFLREGTSIHDFYHPPFTVIGGNDPRAMSSVHSLYTAIQAEVYEVPLRVAEMLKYTSNAYHALKVTFANEIGVLCKQQGIDSHAVMEIFCHDTRLNISPAYLKPGFAFGGSCLPKDLRALLYLARHLDTSTPLLEAILPSNRGHVDNAFDLVTATGKKRVGVLGFSFKAGTDDLRESPIVELMERLIGKGYHLRVYDRNVSLANLQGANRAYIEKEIPHIATLMCATPQEVLEQSDVIVIGNRSPEFNDAIHHTRPGQTVIDLVRILDGDRPADGEYQGICW